MTFNNTTKSLTADLVKGFIGHRLKKAGHENWVEGKQLKLDFDELAHHTLRAIGDEFYAAYVGAFQEMLSTINIHGDDLKEVLYNIFDVTCETGIQWGRLVGMFVFSAMLAVKSMDCNRTDVVENVILWTSDYLDDSKYSNWINQHGGWEGFVQFYRNPKLRNLDVNQHILSKAYSVGVGVFTGAASVAHFFMSMR